MSTTTLPYDSASAVRRQSGVIPYRVTAGVLEVLLITNRSCTRLIVPKGQIARGMSAAASAQKEAYEEAGVEGVTAQREPIGWFAGVRRGERCRIDLWPMRITMMHAAWPEMAFRQRLWVSASDARALLDRADLAELILRLERMLRRARVAA